MANIRIIKRRIKTARNIAQTTRAMQLVAASRMKKAQELALNNKPYAETLVEMTNRLIGKVSLKESSNLENYFMPKKNQDKTLLILITPDKGLAGALVSNYIRFVYKFINIESKQISDYDFLVFGKKGKDQILRLGGNIIAFFDMGMTQPKFSIVPPVIKIMEEGYHSRKYNKISLIYTDFKNTLSQQPKVIKILPLSKDLTSLNNHELKTKKEYFFEPNSEMVLSSLLPHYFEQEIYHGLMESYASEQSARMTAMKNATDNANDIISELTLYYNKARQQVITSEISDIITATLSLE